MPSFALYIRSVIRSNLSLLFSFSMVPRLSFQPMLLPQRSCPLLVDLSTAGQDWLAEPDMFTETDCKTLAPQSSLLEY